MRFYSHQRSRQTQRGSALIAVFWLIAMMGMIVFVGVRVLETDTSVARTNRARIYAMRQAETGLAIGRHPKVGVDEPLLHGTDENGNGYDVIIRSEEARFNINILVGEPGHGMLKRMLTAWQMPADEAAALADALKDWVDADELVSLNGAEKRDYEKEGFDSFPFNREFKNLDEMAFVRGMERLQELKPDWRDFFTVLGDGRVDVNDARPEIIALLANVPLERVEPVMQFRRGRDSALDTMDDMRLTSVPQLAQLLGAFQPAVVNQLSTWVRFDGAIRRIESVGRMAGFSRRLVLITQGDAVLWRGELPTNEN